MLLTRREDPLSPRGHFKEHTSGLLAPYLLSLPCSSSFLQALSPLLTLPLHPAATIPLPLLPTFIFCLLRHFTYTSQAVKQAGPSQTWPDFFPSSSHSLGPLGFACWVCPCWLVIRRPIHQRMNDLLFPLKRRREISCFCSTSRKPVLSRRVKGILARVFCTATVCKILVIDILKLCLFLYF